MTGPISAGTLTNDIARTRSDFAHGPQQYEAADRHHQGAAHPLQDARAHQFGQIHRHAAGDRAQGEDDNRQAEDAARAKAVRGPAADRDEDGEAQQVAGDRDVEAQWALAERTGDRRQRRRNHSGVEVLHEHRAGDDKRHQRLARQAQTHPRPSTAAPCFAGLRLCCRAARLKPTRDGWGPGLDPASSDRAGTRARGE